MKQVSVKSNNYKHGMSNTRLHNIWCGISSRCNNEKEENFKKYGAKGVKRCSEWDNFNNFMSWSLLNGYEDNLSIDRKDNNIGYTPLNCRWVDDSAQMYNRRPAEEWNFTAKEKAGKIVGVNFDKKRKKWIASIFFKSTGHKQKRFETKDEAITKRDEWERLKQQAIEMMEG